MPPIPFAAVTHYAAAVGRIRLPVCIILRLLRVPLLLHILPQSETHLRNANFPAPTGDTEAIPKSQCARGCPNPKHISITIRNAGKRTEPKRTIGPLGPEISLFQLLRFLSIREL